MALAMGSIMAVEAVLLSHMDRKEVVTIIPRMSLGTEDVRGSSRTGVQEVFCLNLPLLGLHPAHSFHREKVKVWREQVSDQAGTKSSHQPLDLRKLAQCMQVNSPQVYKVK